MKKGIIMEVSEAFLTVLTPEGEFVRAKNQNLAYSIGEEIFFFPLLSEENSRRAAFGRKLFKLKPVWYGMAALIILMAGVLIPMYQNNVAYAYMSIDANPSIELGVNKKMKVVEITGYNQEGKRVISELDNWKNKDFLDITQTILTEIQKDEKLNDTGQVIISTVRMEKQEDEVEMKLNENIKAIKKVATQQQIELTVLTGTEKDLEEAHKRGITAGKYHVKDQKPTVDKINENTSPKKPEKQDIKEDTKDQTGNLAVEKEKGNNNSNKSQNKQIEEKKQEDKNQKKEDKKGKDSNKNKHNNNPNNNKNKSWPHNQKNQKD